VIADRYEALEVVPAGAAVKARDLQTAQTVMLRPITRVDERVCGLFHPALVAIFDVVRDGKAAYAACEFVQGRSLRLIMGGQVFNVRRATEIVGEVADAVAELHARGIFHGAITLDTVLLTAKGKAKLDLVHAAESDEAVDVEQLRALFAALVGQRHPELDTAGSAAVLAARLRSL
jgi:tRNA A-37 threonylcarbamoyl transferase component Bud32